MNNKTKWSVIIVVTLIVFVSGYVFYRQFNPVVQVDQAQYQAGGNEIAIDAESSGADSLEDNDFDAEIASFKEDIASSEADINTLSSNGINVENYKQSLQAVKDLVNQAQEKINAGALAEGDSLLETADNDLSDLEDSLASSLETINK